MSTITELLTQVTATPHVTDVYVANARDVPVENLRRALKVLAFMGFATLEDGGDLGWTWRASQPSPTSPRVAELRAEAAKPLEAFLASPCFLALETEMKAYHRAQS